MRDGGFRFDLRVADGFPSHPQATDPLLIEDPVNVLNNIGKNCYKVGAVQGAFVEALERLKIIAVRYNSFQRSKAGTRVTGTGKHMGSRDEVTLRPANDGTTHTSRHRRRNSGTSNTNINKTNKLASDSILPLVSSSAVEAIAAPVASKSENSFVQSRVRNLSAKIQGEKAGTTKSSSSAASSCHAATNSSLAAGDDKTAVPELLDDDTHAVCRKESLVNACDSGRPREEELTDRKDESAVSAAGDSRLNDVNNKMKEPTEATMDDYLPTERPDDRLALLTEIFFTPTSCR